MQEAIRYAHRPLPRDAAGTGREGVAGMIDLVLDLQTELQELAAIEAESIGWQPLCDGAYLHVGDPDEKEVVITVVGIADAGMTGVNVLWVVG